MGRKINFFNFRDDENIESGTEERDRFISLIDGITDIGVEALRSNDIFISLSG